MKRYTVDRKTTMKNGKVEDDYIVIVKWVHDYPMTVGSIDINDVEDVISKIQHATRP